MKSRERGLFLHKRVRRLVEARAQRFASGIEVGVRRRTIVGIFEKIRLNAEIRPVSAFVA